MYEILMDRYNSVHHMINANGIFPSTADAYRYEQAYSSTNCQREPYTTTPELHASRGSERWSA